MDKESCILFGVVIFLSILDIKGSNVPEVTIPHGRLQGIHLKTTNGINYDAFLGIPYARPPVGGLRFKDPLPALPWNGVYNASTYGSDCLQFMHAGYHVTGSEDCLFINVYRPQPSETSNELRDVIAFIHGGAFMSSSPKYFEPISLIEEGVIFVSFSYRLGPLGFLSTGDKVLPGNLGLKDQTAALRWIRDNVKQFGGNPDSVTLTGLSAGAVSVHYHYVSPLSRGLFHRGISLSGAVLNPWGLSESAPQKTKKLAAALGCPTDNSEDLVECLNTRPAEQIVQQVPNFMAFLYNPFTPFGPVVEPEGAENVFLTRHPYKAIKEGQAAKVPWLASFDMDEGLYPAVEFIEDQDMLNRLENNWTDLAPHLLDYNFTVKCKNREEVADKLRQQYLKGKTVANSVTELVQMVGDRLFGAGIAQSVLMQAATSAASNAPVYMYRFGYRGKTSFAEYFLKSDVNYGVFHTDDVGYILQLAVRMDETEDDRAMGKKMVNLWISFARKGVPEFFDGTPLPVVQEGLPKLTYLEIRSPTNATVETVDDLGNTKFWASLPLKEELRLPKSIRSQDEL